MYVMKRSATTKEPTNKLKALFASAATVRPRQYCCRVAQGIRQDNYHTCLGFSNAANDVILAKVKMIIFESGPTNLPLNYFVFKLSSVNFRAKRVAELNGLHDDEVSLSWVQRLGRIFIEDVCKQMLYFFTSIH